MRFPTYIIVLLGGLFYSELSIQANIIVENRDNLYVDIDKDFVDNHGKQKDGHFFGSQSYYYIGYEDFETVSSPEFQKNFTRSEKEYLSFAMKEQQFWVKISFLNNSPIDKTIYMFPEINYSRNLSVYHDTLIASLNPKDILQKRVVELNIKANSTSTFFIKRFCMLSQRQSFTYWLDRSNLVDYLISLKSNWGILIAIFAMSLIFTFILLISYRSSTYIYYCAYLLSFIGYATLLWGVVAVPYSDYFINGTASLLGIFAVLFIIRFLSINGRVKYVMLLPGCIYILAMVTNFFDLSLAMITNSIASGLGALFYIVYACYLYIKDRERHVLIFITAYGSLMIGTVIQLLMWHGMIPLTFPKMILYSAGFENILMLLALADKIYNTEKERLKSYGEISHSYDQLQKVFYPHQLTSMKKGSHLETTMPIGSHDACVISFDIADASQIKAGKVKEFLRDIFSNCNRLMMENYKEDDDVNLVISNGFRIKEMGDGLLCSVGFPYKSPTNDPFMDALALAEAFMEMFNQKVIEFNYPQDILCGCGIAYGPIETFYPDASPIDYDAYGKSIVLASRYQAMRKAILTSLQLEGNILILTETVFNSIDKSKRKDFTKFGFEEHDIWVRHDPNASCLYYRLTSDIKTY